VESLSVPIQQLSRVAATAPQALSSSQRAALEQLMPLTDFGRTYAPGLVDNVKWDEAFDSRPLRSEPLRYAALYFDLGIHHPGAYLQAWALDTFGFWAPGVKYWYGSLEPRVEPNALGIEGHDLTGGWLDPSRAWYPGSGTLAVVLIAAIALVGASSRPRLLVGFAGPAVIWLLGLATTPAAFGLRYVLPLVTMLPVFVALTTAAYRASAPASEASRRGIGRTP
jgi:hypothetical protein